MLSPPIAFTVKKGSALRVDIASSCKNYVNHANVKGHWAKITDTKTAHNTLYLNGAYIELSEEI